MKVRPLRWIFQLSMGLLVVSPVAAFAADSAAKNRPTPSPTPAQASTASLRIWKDQFASKRAIRVQVQSKVKKASNVDLHLPVEGYRFAEYVDLPVGNVTVTVSEEDGSKDKLLSLPLTLRAGTYSTLLLREKAGEVASELIDDTPPDESLLIGELTVRNFTSDLSRLQIRLGEDASFRLNSPESFVQIRGLERKLVEVETSGALKGGKTVQWTTEIDFKKNRKATLLIYPDSYGRIRPRVTVDGESSAAIAAEDAQ